MTTPARNPTWRALVRAVCPGDGLTDPVVNRVLDEIELTVAALPTTSRMALGVAIRLLDVAPTLRDRSWRRFSMLSPSDGRALLSWMRRDHPRGWMALGLLRDLVVIAYYELPETRRAVGYDPDPWIAARAAQRAERWRDDIDRHRRLIVEPSPLRTRPASSGAATSRRSGAIRSGTDLPSGIAECDVVVVGSGAGGAVVAAELAEAGMSVMVVEEGGHHATDEFTTSTSDMLRMLYRDTGASTTLGRAPIQYSEGRCVGGSTVVNGGMAFRASERVLDGWSTTSGDRSLARTGLDDEYRRVERFLSVGPPDPGSEGHDQELMRRGAEALGWRVIEDRRAHVHCGGCNVCTWGCPTGAKQSTLVSYLPRAVSFGATVWSDCRVDRVMMRGKRAVGIEGRVLRGPPGRDFTIMARRVVVACGAIQTPALLQRSGVRTPSGRLGSHLVVHPGTAVTAVFDEGVDGWKGAHQSCQVREFESEGILLAAVNLPPSLVARTFPCEGDDLGRAMLGYNHVVTAGALVEDRGWGRVKATGRDGVLATYRLDDRDAAAAVRGTALLCEALFEAGAHTIHLPFVGMPPLRPDGLRALAATPIPAERMMLSTVHLMGTAGLGTDPMESVCGPFGAVHDAADLYVADASLFPAPVGVNPQLTIMALAVRVAAGIIDRWSNT